MNDTDLDGKALEALVVDNQDLEELETLLDQFNIFEAVGAVHAEVRHSDFLSFLLDPSQNHGLGDIFVKRLLQRALATLPEQTLPITPIDLDIWDLNEIMVQREWQNIDILLTDERNRLAVIIENKIHAGEHGEQLQRYRRTVSQHYPDWHILGLFLTPEGDQPKDDSYIPVDYTLVCTILEQLMEARSSSVGPDVKVAISHYTQMLRRHIVNESEIADLCRRIYRKHQRAFNLIYEYRPDRQGEIGELLKGLIEDQHSLVLDRTVKSYINFGVREWDVPILLQGDGWTRSKRMLLFEFHNSEDRLWLHLVIGPGPQDTRQRLMDMAHANKPPFKPSQKALAKKWNAIYERQILTPTDYEETAAEDIESEINKKWLQFLEHDLPQIMSIMKSENWLWTS